METDPLLGRVLGDTYRIEGRLGMGGMGAVYRARHVRTGRAYAVKVLLAEMAREPRAFERFRREAEALGGLGHVGIVAIHDYHHGADGLAYLAMDLLQGEDLAARIERVGGVPWDQARSIFEQVASALSAAHSLGILHRDLKPANIFLATVPGAPERAVLLDFGLVKMAHEGGHAHLTETGTVMGTPAYMSPEQARGAEVDARTDLYSLGVVLHHLVCGSPPFDGPNTTAILAKVLTDPPPSAEARAPHPVPPGLDDLLHVALAKDATERFGDVPTFVAAVRALTATIPVTGAVASAIPETAPQRFAVAAAPTPATRPAAAQPTPRPASARSPLRPVLWLGALGAAVAMVAGASALFWVWLASSPNAPTAVSDIAPVAPGTVPIAAPPHLDPVAPVPDVAEPEQLPTGSDVVVDTAGPPGGRRQARTAQSLAAPPPFAAAPAPPVSGPGAVPTPPAGVAGAVDRMSVSDWHGCISAARAAPVSPQTLQVQVTCGLQLHNASVVRRACDEHVRRYPDHPFSRSCPGMVLAAGG